MSDAHQAQVLRAAQAALRAGDADRALRIAGQLLATGAHLSEHLLLHANAALAAEDTMAALESLRVLVQRHPGEQSIRAGLATACNRHGNRLLQQGLPETATAAFREALALQPAHPLAGFNLALALNQDGRRTEALQALQLHLRQHPDDLEAALQQAWWQLPAAEARTRIASLLDHPTTDRLPPQLAALAAAEVGRAGMALSMLQRLPVQRQASMALDVGDRLRGNGQRAPAIAAYRHGAASAPDSSLRLELGAALTVSRLPVSVARIADERQSFAAGLEALERKWTDEHVGRPGRTLEELCWSNFFLAYQGGDDRQLQRGFARLLERAAVRIAPHLAEPSATVVAGRIGLLSSCWRDCTAGAYFGGWVRWLTEAGYEVHLYQLGPEADAVTAELAGLVRRYHFDPGVSLQSLAQRLREDRLDLLIYPELGMDARLLPLAALRLARRQVVGWGHPVTTGFDGFDAYLTCAEMEPVDAQLHYHEPLRMLAGLGVDYRRPAVPARVGRGELGLPETVPLVLVPQSLFKLHPDTDETLARIAAEVPDVRLLLFAADGDPLRQHYLDRIAPAFRRLGLSPEDALLWLAPTSRECYLQINSVCDLMLDSLHFTGGNASIDALSVGLPILTCPGRFMRGRQTTAMLQSIGTAKHLVCPDPGHLADRARELLASGTLPEMANQIGASHPQLFDSTAARESFLLAVATLLQQA